MEETTIWKGTPSQWKNIFPFTIFGTWFLISLILWVMQIFDKEEVKLDAINDAVSKGADFEQTAATAEAMANATSLLILFIPALIILYRYLVIKTWKIEITNQRIIEERGVFSKITHETELFRIKDVKLREPFLMRLIKLSHLFLNTSDRSHPVIKIPAIYEGKAIREKLRSAVDQRRDEKGVREIDL